MQPAPDRRRRCLGDALLDDEAMQLSAREASQRPVVLDRQLARDGDDVGDLLRGKRRGRPARGLSVSPSMPCSQNLRRHLLTTSG